MILNYIKNNSTTLIKVFLFISLVICFGHTDSVYAKKTLGDAVGTLDTVVAPTGIDQPTPDAITGVVFKGVFATVGLLFFVLIFYAGFTWMMARGEEANVTKARDTVIAATIGLIIVVSAYAITNLVVDRIINGKTGSSTDSSGDGGTGTAPNMSGNESLGCCITPSTNDTVLNPFVAPMMSIQSQTGCENLANVRFGVDNDGNEVYKTKQSTKWEFYPSLNSASCSKMLECWQGGSPNQDCISGVNEQANPYNQINTSWCISDGSCIVEAPEICPSDVFSTEQSCQSALQEQKSTDISSQQD